MRHARRSTIKVMRFHGAVIAAICITSSGAKAKPGPLMPQNPATFDGKTWCGLTLGEMNWRQVKKTVRLSKSGRYRHSTEAVQPKDSTREVDLFFSPGSADEARLCSFLLKHTGLAPTVSSAKHNLSAPKTFYPRERFEDWSLLTSPGKGVVFFIVNGEAPVVMMVPPAALSRLTARLSSTRTPILVRRDPHANAARIMEFGTVRVNDTIRGLLALSSTERARRESEMKDTTARGTMRYRVGATGSYTIDVTGTGNAAEGGNLTVTATIDGNSPYGPLHVTKSSYASWPKARKPGDAYLNAANLNAYYTKALLEATIAVEQAFAAEMETAGPPPLSKVREDIWNAYIYTLAAASAATVAH